MTADREQELLARIVQAARSIPVRLGPNAAALAERGEPVTLNFTEAEAIAAAVLPVLEAAVTQAVAAERAYWQELLAETNSRADKLHSQAQKAAAERKRVLDEAIAAVEDPERRCDADWRENRRGGLGWEAARAVLREMRAGGVS
jgi:hypothetical protein